MTIGRTTVKTLHNVEKSLSIHAVLSNFQNTFNWDMICGFRLKIMGVIIFCQKYWAKDCTFISRFVIWKQRHLWDIVIWNYLSFSNFTFLPQKYFHVILFVFQGMEPVDLLQNRHILPAKAMQPPKVRLQTELWNR